MNSAGRSSQDVGLPPVTQNPDGRMRRVGVEIEFIGLTAEEACEIVRPIIGGTVRPLSDYEICIDSEIHGEWRIERDQEQLKEIGRRRQREESKEGSSIMDTAAEAALSIGSELLVPLELISPPLPMNELDQFQKLVSALGEAGARGTDENLLYAFGLQFNPELPSLKASAIVKYLQAFFCLQDWLTKRSAVDYTRQLTNFAEPFSRDYIQHVLAEAHEPEMAELIDDYLRFNPTRNRSLDMLPLFAYIDEDRVRRALPDPRIKSRPTFHYRLPNSNIGNKDWTIFVAWDDWLAVEWLASQDEYLDELRAKYRKEMDKIFSVIYSDWHKQVDVWLKTHRE